jgi:hypothetical protein
MASSALFNERKVQGGRGRDGDLTRTGLREREAATTARCLVATEVDGGTGTKLGCGLLGRRKLAVDGIGRRRRRLFMRRGPLGGTSSRGAGAGMDSMVSGRRRTPWSSPTRLRA